MSVDLLPTYRPFLERDVAAGLSDPAIAAKLGVSERTVLRWRIRAGLPSQWKPAVPAHGTVTRYASPHRCRCPLCREANRVAHDEYMRSANRRHATPNAGAAWTAQDEAVLLDDTRGPLSVRARELGRTYGACLERLRLIRSRDS